MSYQLVVISGPNQGLVVSLTEGSRVVLGRGNSACVRL